MTYFKGSWLRLKGFSGAHGQHKYRMREGLANEQAKSFIVRKPLTEELIQEHLKGTNGVGSIPINEEDNNCKFGALDIDQYPLDLVALDKKLQKMKVPCVVCRSKSGGAHIFFFFQDYINAGEFRDKAKFLPYLVTAAVKFSQSKNKFLSNVAMWGTLLTCRTLMRNKLSASRLRKTESQRH